MKIARRTAIGILASTPLAAEQQQNQSPVAGSVSLDWLDKAPPPQPLGITWGVPWARGTVRRDQTFALTANGQALPLQTWPLAYWPDGTLKFSAFATVAGKAPPLKLTEAAQSIEIDTGAMQARLGRSGPALIESLKIDGARSIATVGSFARWRAGLPSAAKSGAPPSNRAARG
jgi:YetA-like protein